MLKKIKNNFKHETKRRVVIKFILIFLIIILYFIFLANKYGTNEGLSITTLTWAFFVLCTPVADAGFLIDFPMRLITGIRMFYSEIIVWLFAIIISMYYSIASPEIFQTNLLTNIFGKIINNPFPYWSIIFISFIGTFFSIFFGDELIDTARHIHRKKHIKHKSKYYIIIAIFIIAATIIIYDLLLRNFGIEISS